jgi:flagellar export protein FliJ
MAAKDLHTLIRLRKWEVDEKQRAVAALLRREEAVLAAQRALAEEIEREKAFVGQADVQATFTFSAYLERCEERRQDMDKALAEVRHMIDAARDELAEAYRRLKTFEVTQEQREDAEEKEFNRREQIDLDEIGLNLHRRRTSAV